MKHHPLASSSGAPTSVVLCTSPAVSLLRSSATKRPRASLRRCRQEKQRAREIAEAARRKALEAQLLEKREEEKARQRLEKIQEYRQKKVGTPFAGLLRHFCKPFVVARCR